MDNELLRNGSGYIDPTAYEAFKNMQKGNFKMENMKANRFEPKRGDVYFVSKKDTKTGEIKAIPCVVVSSDEYNNESEYIMVADISERANPELHQNAPIMCRVPSIAMCDRMRMVKREWIGEYIRTATDEEMHALSDALGFVFGIVVNLTDAILNGGDHADLVENKTLVKITEEQEQIIEKQKEHILELRDINNKCLNEIDHLNQERDNLKTIIERQAKEIKELNAMNNEMANIAVELEDSGQQSDFYKQFYEDLFRSDKKIEIKVG